MDKSKEEIISDKIYEWLRYAFHYALKMAEIHNDKTIAPAHCLTVLRYDSEKFMNELKEILI